MKSKTNKQLKTILKVFGSLWFTRWVAGYPVVRSCRVGLGASPHPIYSIIFISCIFFFVGCQNSAKQLLATDESQVKLRQIQTRAFDTTDKKKTLRTVISTLQDLGFVIDKADETLGTVSGTKLDGYALRLTVMVRPRGETQLLVRANAQYNIEAVEDPEPYQQFFTSLGKAMFLTAHNVD